MPSVTFIEADGAERLILATTGNSLMEAARENGVPGIDADCGGVCACATCHVYVNEDWFDRVGQPGPDEKEMLECATDPRDNSRLSCQIRLDNALDGLVVQLPATQR
jgi:2Fe-2S ferredoxin